jgi:Ca2+-transporting ATPase
METDAVFASLGTKVLGLSEESVKERFTHYGANVLPESVPRSGWSLFFDQFKSLPVMLLGAAAGLSLATGGAVDALVILGVVAINATIGYVTETQAEKTIHSLKSLVRPSALVIREGRAKEIRGEEVVPGDILVLRPGTYIAADSRLVEADRLSVDESALTGESLPIFKQTAPLSSADSFGEIPLGDRVNMVYMGTLVTGGQGIAVVVATGRFTEMGQIQFLVGEAQSPDTPMERQLDRMGTQLVLVGGAVCGVVFVIGLLRGIGFLQMLKTAISLAVAAVPEGLPTIATTTLALGIKNMRRHHVLIRHLNAVETLGSVQTICLDKTGTLTRNKMTVVAVHSGMRRIQVAGGKFFAGNEWVDPVSCDELLRLLHVSVLCSETVISRNAGGEYFLQGSPTENALVLAAIGAEVEVLRLREKYPMVKMNHRADNRNFMSTVHTVEPEGQLVTVKGSPLEVLALCRWYVRDGKKLPLTEQERLEIEIANERMAGEALRVLGMAYAQLDHNQEADPAKGLIWLGLVGMADPIRDGVRGLIETFHRAGIDTVMITGDQSPTAYAIGRELNLSGGEQLEILDSTHLSNIDPEVMKALSGKVHVFARVSPAHKLQIVQALQRAGKVVAMTGDGINDGPALKAADIGIAMGHTGTDVAREVADVVLEDDHLETMIIAVQHGRTIYNNIRKSVRFLLATNLSEIMVMFVALAGGLGQPLNSMQLLWINLISDIFPGLALALEPPEPDVLSRPPRNPEEPIIQTSDFKRIGFEAGMISAGAIGAYAYGLACYGAGPTAGTMAFMSLTSGQLLHALSCRSETHRLWEQNGLPPNRWLQWALAGSLALQGLTLAVPGLRGLLGLAPIGLIDGLIVGGSAFLPLAVNETTKIKRDRVGAHLRVRPDRVAEF